MGFVNPGRNSHSRTSGKRKSPTTRPSPRSTSSKSSSPASRRSFKRQNSTISSTSFSSRCSTPSYHYRHHTPRLSRFESLPAELLYRVFEHSCNLSLTKSSLHLTHTFAVKHLQLNYVHHRCENPSALSETFTLRFFTASFLELWERRFGRLDASGALLPTRLLKAPWSEGGIELFTALIERGAGLGVEDVDVHLSTLHSALVAGRIDVVRLLVEAGLKPDTESLRLAMKYTVGDEGDLGVCRLLVGHGADVGDVGVWRMALGLGKRGGERALGWLLEGAAPPGEVLGELSCR